MSQNFNRCTAVCIAWRLAVGLPRTDPDTNDAGR